MILQDALIKVLALNLAAKNTLWLMKKETILLKTNTFYLLKIIIYLDILIN